MVMWVSPDRRFLPTHRKRGKKPARGPHQSGMTLHKQPPAHKDCGHGPPLDVEAWRRCRALEAGFSPDLAQAVAADVRVDLHALLELVDRGCPPELALRIVAPLPAGSAR